MKISWKYFEYQQGHGGNPLPKTDRKTILSISTTAHPHTLVLWQVPIRIYIDLRMRKASIKDVTSYSDALRRTCIDNGKWRNPAETWQKPLRVAVIFNFQ